MKKISSAFLVCVLLVGTVFALASCGGGLSGTYELSEDGMTQTIKFSGKNLEMTMKAGDESMTLKYTYELNEDETKITLTADKASLKQYYADMMGVEASTVTDAMLEESGMLEPQELDFEKGDDFVKIEDMKYTKK